MHEDHGTSGTSDGNDRWADHINEAYYDGFGAEFGRVSRDRINWMCGQARGESVLDVGCSQGIASILMAREGMRVVGVDIYQPAIDYALAERAKEIESVAARLDFRCVDLASLDEERFDTVLMGEVIEHQTNPARFVSQAARLVAPGGRLVITVPFGLHPWPDHKSIIFPCSLYVPIFREFQLSFLEVNKGYIRMIAERRADNDAAVDMRCDLLLEATEKGLVQWQERYYELDTRLQAISKAKSQAEDSLAKLRAERESLLERQREHDKALALCSHEVQMLRAAADDSGRQGEQAQLVREHAARRDEQSARIGKLLDDISVHEKLSMQASEALIKAENARQDAVRQLDALQREYKTLSEALGALTQAKEQAERQLGDCHHRLDEMNRREEESKHAREDEINGIRREARESRAAEERARKELAEACSQRDELAKSEGILRERLDALEKEYQVAQHKRTGHYLHLEAERGRTRKLIPMLEELHRENQLYRRSVALEVGRAILELRSIRGMIRFPRAMAMAWAAYRRRGRGDIAIEPLILPRIEAVNLPPVKDSTQGAATAATASRRLGRKGGKSANEERKALSALGWDQELRPSLVPVVSVLDEFSRSCFMPHASLIEPRPDNWEALLEQYEPKLLLVESSWKGNYGTWQYRVANYAHPPGRELAEMVDGFRVRGIPTVFWNKEDPVHFNNFIGAASQFDFVLTTAEEAVPKYREKTSASIGVLQFAAEDSLHNPIGSSRRNGKVCFAGSFYANRFHERRDDQLMLLDAAAAFDFDIFDRNHDPKATTRSDFAFPERFSRFVRGRMPYTTMGKAYREYRVFLNVNSVIDSPTMFSRRVFELLACGTPVVSTWSLGTEETFGNDLVWHVRNQEEAAEAIRVLMTDDREWRRRSLAGIRAVLSRHTFRHRFRQVLDFAGLRDERNDEFRQIMAVAEVSTAREASAVAESFARQRVDDGVSKRLLLVARGGSAVDVSGADVEVLRDPVANLAEILDRRCASDAGGLLALMSPRALYGAHHLQDLVHAARYSGAALVGRPMDSHDESQYQYGTPLDSRSLLINIRALRDSGISVRGLESVSERIWTQRQGKYVYATDTANFKGMDDVMDAGRQTAELSEIEI